MINLQNDKDYYILIDGQGGDFGGGRIFESKEEVFEQFAEWADSDEIDISNYTFRDLIDTWTIEIRRYDGKEFFELTDSELNYKK
jgi:hypothetical protein